MFGLDALLGIGNKLIDKLIPDPQAKAAAQLELAKMQQTGELAQLQADVSEQQELTKRRQADMSSDSWLSKNIRPLVLIFLLIAYTGFAIASMFNYETRGSYVELLGNWGMVVMSFYFGGRTFEKIADKVKK